MEYNPGDWTGAQSRSQQFAVTVILIPDAVNTVTWTPDDGWRYHPKHVERFTDINKLYIVASCWTIIGIYFDNSLKKLYNNIFWIRFACPKLRTDKRCPRYFDDCVEAVLDLTLLPRSTWEQRSSVLLRSVLVEVSGQHIGPIFNNQESCWVIMQRVLVNPYRPIFRGQECQRIVVIPYRRFGTTYRSRIQGLGMPARSGNSISKFWYR